jgi:hypothetical protein
LYIELIDVGAMRKTRLILEFFVLDRWKNVGKCEDEELYLHWAPSGQNPLSGVGTGASIL